MRSGVGLIQVSVAGRAPVWFCVDPDADDPVSDALLANGRFDGPAESVALDLVVEGSRLLDVGCGVGTLALPASALGAEVAAVDRSDETLELLWSAATRNGFGGLRPVHADVGAGPGSPSDWPGIDALLEDVGWDTVDVIRLDTGGAEAGIVEEALCLRAPHRPAAVVVSCDAAGLARLGSSVAGLHEALCEAGYELYLVDPVRAGVLARTAPGDVQPANRAAYVALAAGFDGLAPRRRAAPRLDRAEVSRRVVDGAASDDPVERIHAAGLIVHGPGWLRTDPAVPAALRALEADVSPVVRAAATVRSASMEEGVAGAREPGAEGAPAGDLVLLAVDVAVRSSSAGFERPAGAGRLDELVLTGVSTHLRPGAMLGVLVEDEVVATELLSTLAGIERPAEGSLGVPARPLLISGLGRLIEPGLSVEENIVVLGAFFGGHVGDVTARTTELADRVGLRAALALRLADLDPVAVERLGLAVALEFAAGSLVLIDCLPELGDPAFRRWARGRLDALRLTGTSIVQVVRDATRLLGKPDRLLWAGGGSVVACGHPESVSAAFRNRTSRPEPSSGIRAAEALTAP